MAEKKKIEIVSTMSCSFYCSRSIGLRRFTQVNDVSKRGTSNRNNKYTVDFWVLNRIRWLWVCGSFYNWRSVHTYTYTHTTTTIQHSSDSQRFFIVHCSSIDSRVLVCCNSCRPFPAIHRHCYSTAYCSMHEHKFTSTSTIPSHMRASKLLIL